MVAVHGLDAAVLGAGWLPGAARLAPQRIFLLTARLYLRDLVLEGGDLRDELGLL